MSNKKLLVVGELNIDLILNQIQGFPEIGTEKIAENMDFTLGSSSAILASNIAALGVSTSFCGLLGQDSFGDFILKELQKKKVNTRFVHRTQEAKTGITVVMNYDQDRANITYCGAMNVLSMEHIPWGNISEFSHLHFSNYFLQPGMKPFIAELFKKAKEEGLTTSLDLQVDPEDKWDFDYKNCLPFVDVFLPNESELLNLSGKNNLEDAIEMIKSYTNILALKLGDKGGRVVTKSEDITIKPYLNKKYKDAIGAGDSFNAGFLKKFIQGETLSTCLEFANLTGSLSTTAAGGTGAFRDEKEIEIKIQQIRNKKL
ncbi:carbohydrate kinase family protein [Salegentibacter salegens]|uniref:Sugar or nucleoside kinase, ribokinase family n=1 Tax=Salegentibacter salegens TaxID=143223 RepID=A0A1M7NNT9_9FLAO|nr:carbohydrate kinase family protein [Salegentibacter salegens]PRX40007.1 sugar/nucleoside kinase (ribokinase family) [Salegentibacter salegens]SHN05207.1 Sugar or nucleoside kinase, ribokinase family [Salegentibacter salegens]